MSLLPDVEGALIFLRKWSSGPWVLTAIPVDKRGIETATFTALEDVPTWLKHHSKDNVYFSVNPLRRHVTKKAEREDVASLDWLHVDVDPRAMEDLAEERERILGLFTDNLPDGVPKPTCVIFSGGGYQAFWRLEEPFAVNGEAERYEAAKLWNQQLELLFGADPCHNVDRIMRLPGTINWPDEKKRAKGREPALAKLVSWDDDATYPLDDFTPSSPIQVPAITASSPNVQVQVSGNVARIGSLDDLPVPDLCKVVIAQGCDPDDPARFSKGDGSVELDRSKALHYVCCQLVRGGVEDDVIYALITDPDWGISESVLNKGSGIERYALRQIQQAKEHAIDPTLRELNEQHAVIGSIGGKCRILSEEYDAALDRHRITYQTFTDFEHRYCNRFVDVQDAKGKTTRWPAGKWWVHHEDRRQYKYITFAPAREIQGAYNLWKGFAFDAKPGRPCDLFLTHVMDNVCDGRQDLYDYLMGWMATAVQHPDRPGQVAIVLRGRQGVGKSSFARVFGKLWGRHFLPVSNSKHLVGDFNAHLRDCVVLFGDEAFYAGDKKHESILKTLVTEDTIAVEAKGVDVEMAPNYVHLIMASNDDWVVPAGHDERRFLVLDVAAHQMQASSYFGPMMRELEAGGYEALLHKLMTHDLSDFDVRKVPKTAALQEQKVYSMTPEKEWWYTALREGLICGSDGWPRHVVSSHLVYDFVSYVKAFGNTTRSNATKLGTFMQRACPDGWKLRGQLAGTGHEVIGEDGKPRKVNRPRVYLLPPLTVCRAHFDEHFGGPFPWPEPEQVTTEEDGVF